VFRRHIHIHTLTNVPHEQRRLAKPEVQISSSGTNVAYVQGRGAPSCSRVISSSEKIGARGKTPALPVHCTESVDIVHALIYWALGQDCLESPTSPCRACVGSAASSHLAEAAEYDD
jgi:hypothetical protein